MEYKHRGVDIIIPIYNAFDDLQICIKSLKQYTDLEYHRLILINDKSSDERIASYLDDIAGHNVIVIHNKVNMGFSANINLGLAQSDEHDVILLNSDTIVTRNWVEKLLKCAYTDETIATVTPLSNNATIYSVPEYFEENVIPEGFTLETYAELIETCSLKKYPSTPMAHGFCMFIKREVVRKIGMFDAETFGKGYGEENDFCYRAEQMGYRHVMCDDTYIYHNGTSSFPSEEKQRYIKEHEQIIKERYPVQHQKSVVYCMNRPNEDVRMNIKIQTVLSNDKKNILYLLHSDFRTDAEDNVGGTQLHVKDLCDGLRKYFNIFVAARNHDYLNLTAYIGEEELFFQYYIGNASPFPVYRNLEFEKVYSKLLDSFRIDAVHIHHTADLTLELYYQANLRRLPIFTTLHDYYSICPTIKLVNQAGEFCKEIETTLMCRDCLDKRCGIVPSLNFISVWRMEQKQALQLTTKIFVPSENAKKIFLDYYPEIEDKICTIPHGSRLLATTDTMKIDSGNRKNHSFHIAFIGGISEEKGSHCAAEMIKHGSGDIQWYLFGMLGTPELAALERKNFTKIGQYHREELPDLFQKYQIDLVCILPIWAETFCYTLSEAVMCGIPVIVTDIGALGERVREMRCGWVVSQEATYKDVLEVISEIKDKGSLYNEKKKRAEQAEIKDLAKMCNEYRQIYDEVFLNATYKCGRDVEYAWILQGRGKALGHPGLQGMDSQVYEQLAMVEHQLRDITDSISYKVMKTLSGLKIPFRKQIKGILVKGNALMRKRR